jgi:hypothetical protein
MTFSKIVEAGLLTGPLAPPPEMQGVELNIEFVSTLAQAQRAVGLGSFDRLIGTIALMAPVKPEILDKLDTDQMVDLYADMLAVDPSVIVADENVAIIRDQRAKQQAAAQMAAAAKPAADMAGAMKTMSETDPEALRNVMRPFTGYT